MGYEPRTSALRRFRHLVAFARDAMLREELARCAARDDATAADEDCCTGGPHDLHDLHDLHDRHEHLAPASPMQTPAAARLHDVSFTPWVGATAEETSAAAEGVLGALTPSVEPAAGARFPVEHLYAALATPSVVQSLLSVLAEQSRAIALVREAHALGAATLPPEVAVVLERVAAAALA